MQQDKNNYFKQLNQKQLVLILEIKLQSPTRNRSLLKWNNEYTKQSGIRGWHFKP